MSFNYNPPLPYSWRNKKKAELTPEQIRDIKSCEKDVKHYANKYNRSRSTIQDIQRGKTYSEVE